MVRISSRDDALSTGPNANTPPVTQRTTGPRARHLDGLGGRAGATALTSERTERAPRRGR
ncbi:hypothetical protein GCM10010428_79350 [Actinosynnema pretiosum subsp. pretiosum]